MIAFAVYTSQTNLSDTSMHYGASYGLCIVSWLGAWIIGAMSIGVFLMGRNSASQSTQPPVGYMPS